MRHLPATTRIAIATLYIRTRDARRLTMTTRLNQGIGSIPANDAKAAEIATWNALQAVLANVHADRSTLPTSEFVRLVGRRGALQQQKAA